jgi:hypothetical protein
VEWSDYDAALDRAEGNAGTCDEAAALASYCEHVLPRVVGAVAGRWVWAAAMEQGISFVELARLAATDVDTVIRLSLGLVKFSVGEGVAVSPWIGGWLEG